MTLSVDQRNCQNFIFLRNFYQIFSIEIFLSKKNKSNSHSEIVELKKKTRKKFLGTDWYRVPARKKFLGTDWYRVPARLKIMGTRYRGNFHLCRPLVWTQFITLIFHKILAKISWKNKISVDFFDPPQRLTLIIMTDQKALKKLYYTLKFTFLTDKDNLEDFPLCGVVWVRCLTSLRRWLSPRPLSLGERLCRAESAHDSSFGRFSTKFRVQYIEISKVTRSCSFDKKALLVVRERSTVKI